MMGELSEKNIERFWSKVDKKSDDECWEWLGTLIKGYGSIRINTKAYLAHRISWVLHNGEIPAHSSYHGYCVCHTCDNRKCVNPTHLFLGTHTDNMRDMVRKARGVAPDAKGEAHGMHKLTEKQVEEIREKYIPFLLPLSELAKEYNVTKSAIYLIVKNKNWKCKQKRGV